MILWAYNHYNEKDLWQRYHDYIKKIYKKKCQKSV